MSDFRIGEMQRHEEGFYFVEVLSYHTQATTTIHNKYGSWMAGDPDAQRGAEIMRDIGYPLAAALQARKIDTEKSMTKIAAVNPFVAAATGHPFMTTS